MEEINVRWRKAIEGQGLVASCGTVSDATQNLEDGCLKTTNITATHVRREKLV